MYSNKELNDQFPSQVVKLKNQFPITTKTSLKDQFPWKSRKGGIGSGFIDSLARVIALPVYNPPIPSFSTEFGIQSGSYSVNSLPAITLAFSGFSPFILTNTTDDTTYTSLQWKVKNNQTGVYLPITYNQSYVITPNSNPTTDLQSWDIELTVFYRGTEGKAYQSVSAYAAGLDGSVVDFTTNVIAVVGDIIPFSFLNTSLGPFHHLEWVATGITLVGTGTTVTGSVTVDFANIQQPVTVTLNLIDSDNVLLETITTTTTFTVLPRAIARINGNNNDFSTTTSTVEGSVVPYTFTNNSVGTYDTFLWVSGFNLGSGTTVTDIVTVGFPQKPPYPLYTVTLKLFRNQIEVDSVTQTITIISIAKPNRSLFDLVGTGTGKKVNDGIIQFIRQTVVGESCRLYPYPYYTEDNFFDYNYTRPSFKTCKFFITGPTSNDEITLQNPPGIGYEFVPVAASGTTSALYNIVMRTYDDNNVENGQTYMDVIFNYTPIVPSLNNNTSNYNTESFGTTGSIINYTFTNTTSLYAKYQWKSSGITLVGTGTTVTGSVTVGSTSTIFTVTLDIFRNQRTGLVGSIQQSTQITPTNPNLNQMITSNAASLLNLTPQPQSNVSNYSGIHVTWIPTGVGLPAQEPTLFKIQTIGTSPIAATFPLYQGNNASTSSISMSVNSTFSATDQYTLIDTGLTQFIAETMVWSPNLLGANTFTNTSTNPSMSLSFGQSNNTSLFFDSFAISTRVGTTKVYKTAYQCYFGNSSGLPPPSILSNNNYFVGSEGRYLANINGLASVTFQLPTGNKYVALLTGGLIPNSETSAIYGHVHTGFQASLFDVTTRVNNRLITFRKAAGAQGSIIGFFIWNI